MQAPTHILTGMILQSIGLKIKNKQLSIAFIFITGVLSHGILDRIARLTYHPPKADFTDPVWVGYHFIVYTAGIWMLWKFWKPYFPGVLAAILPDIDWIIIHGCTALGIDRSAWYPYPLLHDTLYSIMDRLPPLHLLRRIPSSVHDAINIVYEVALVSLLVWIFMRVKEK